MNIYLRKRTRNASGTLFVTFVLGVAIGFSAAYALFGRPEGIGFPLRMEPRPTTAAVAEQAAVTEQAADAAPETTPDAAPVAPAPSPETPESSTTTAVAEPVPGGDMWPGRYLIIAAPEAIDDTTAAFLGEVRPGGVLLGATQAADPARTLQMVGLIKDAAGFGKALSDLPLIAIEQEGGERNPLQLSSAPSAAELGQIKNAETAEKPGETASETARRLGELTARAALERGIGIVLAPVLDVFPAGIKNDAMAPRVYGANQELVANIGLALADGITSGGAISVAKYYPGIGVGKDRNNGMAILDAESPRLAELMYPFWEAATAGLPGILAGHVAVPSLDPDGEKRPASMSPVLIHRILRKDWKYAGVIVSDDVCSTELAGRGGPGQAAVDALAAGCDALLVLDTDPSVVRSVCAAIQTALEKGVLSRGSLVDSRNRLEQWQNQLAGYDIPQDQPSVELAEEKDIPALPSAALESEQGTAFTPGPTAPVSAAPVSTEPAAAVETSPPPTPVETPEPTPAVETPPPPAPVETPEPAPAVETPPPPAPEPAAELTPEAAPTEAAPTEAAPTEAAPTEAAPTEAAPTEAAPTEAAPTEAAPAETAPADDMVKTVHEIQPGETLGLIAARYGVKQSDVMKWNGMKTSVVKYGFKLDIFRPASAPPLPTPDAAPPAEAAPAADAAPSPPEPAPVAEAEPASAVEPAPSVETAPATDGTTPEQEAVLLANRQKYVVAAGETLETIGKKLGVAPKLIMAWNGLDEATVSEGQVLIVFASGAAAAPSGAEEDGFYTVKQGDNAFRIAEKFGTTVKALLEMNKNVKDPNHLLVGQRIAVPKRP